MSGFPEKGLTSGEVGETSGKSGELPGRSGKLPGNLWIAVKFHSERTSGEVAEKLPGKFGELPGKSGDFPEARGSLTPSQRLSKSVSKLHAEILLKYYLIRRGKKYTPKVFSVRKTQVPQQAQKRFGVYQKACFQGTKKDKKHVHQRGFKVFVGDPFTEYWCIDFGLLLNIRRELQNFGFVTSFPKNSWESRQAMNRIPGPMESLYETYIRNPPRIFVCNRTGRIT